jgi:molybdopterin-guanine dinucleotide biosynthesis protein A
MGCDKALLEIEGEPLWRRQLATLRRLSPEQLMVAGPARAECDCEIIADRFPGAGPLGGIAAALGRSTAPLLLVLAVDLPGMTADFLRSLLTDCRDGAGVVPSIAMPKSCADAPTGSRRYEPLAAIYPVTCAALAINHLERNELSLQRFVRAVLDRGVAQERKIAPGEVGFFVNLNTPADYERFRKRATDLSR